MSGMAKATEAHVSQFPRVGDGLLRRLDVPIPRYTSYPTAPVWTDRRNR